jgi:hypothetical protein
MDDIKKQIKKHGITTKHGLLYIKDRQINLPEADALARKFGFFYAERLVEFLEKNKKNKKEIKNK